MDYGDRVKKGEVLAVLWAPEMEREFDQKKAAVTRAEAAGSNRIQESLKTAEASIRSGEAGVAEAEAGRLRASARTSDGRTRVPQNKGFGRSGDTSPGNWTKRSNRTRAAEATVAEEGEGGVGRSGAGGERANRDRSLADVSVAEANLLMAKADRNQMEAMLQYS